VVEAARDIPPAQGTYIEEDFVMNLQETVLDYQMSTIGSGPSPSALSGQPVG
jgi:hypothetical protein